MKIQSSDPLSKLAVAFYSLVVRQTQQILAHENLTQEHFMLLNRLSEGEQCMSDLSRHRHVSTAAMTGMIDRLEKLGFVERFHALDDRRKVMVRLTTKGAGLLIATATAVAERFEGVSLPQRDVESVSTLLALAAG